MTRSKGSADDLEVLDPDDVDGCADCMNRGPSWPDSAPAVPRASARRHDARSVVAAKIAAVVVAGVVSTTVVARNVGPRPVAPPPITTPAAAVGDAVAAPVATAPTCPPPGERQQALRYLLQSALDTVRDVELDLAAHDPGSATEATRYLRTYTDAAAETIACEAATPADEEQGSAWRAT